MTAPAKLRTKAAMPIIASAMWTQIHALPSAGAERRRGPRAGSWPSGSARATTGSTKAPSTCTPYRRSTSISSSTTTQTAIDTASGQAAQRGAAGLDGQRR